jgi:hypothetical protein
MKAIRFAVVGLTVAVIASPSFARTRDEAIHAAGKYINHVWGNWDGATYRACMAQHGYQE